MKKLIKKIKTFVAKTPYPLIKPAACCLGLAAYAVDRRHRGIVKQNLRFIFPHYSRAHILFLSRQVFINTAITFLEILQLICSSQKQIIQKIRILDPGKNIEMMKRQKKLILLSAHMGNWEIPALLTNIYLGRSLLLVVRTMDNELLHRLMMKFRSRYGNIIIDKKGSVKKMARALRNDQPVGLLVDQDIRPRDAVKTDFLGKAVNATPAAAWMAGRYDCPVVPVFCHRQSNGKLVMEVKSPLPLVKSNNPTKDVSVNTQIINDSVSDAIREHVDQWFWFHKRWKRYYPELYPEEIKRINRRKKKKLKKKLK